MVLTVGVSIFNPIYDSHELQENIGSARTISNIWIIRDYQTFFCWVHFNSVWWYSVLTFIIIRLFAKVIAKSNRIFVRATIDSSSLFLAEQHKLTASERKTTERNPRERRAQAQQQALRKRASQEHSLSSRDPRMVI